VFATKSEGSSISLLPLVRLDCRRLAVTAGSVLVAIEKARRGGSKIPVMEANAAVPHHSSHLCELDESISEKKRTIKNFELWRWEDNVSSI
jgi:hypothetical protein